ncbi:lipase 3-like [Aethina tumida]|uniref:lipase 3-like n=1 Tax=Aethina tumida TaxID=116153 RepID=UPI00214793C2|nr:lipase 3-like [Aethina tumida]
MNIISYLVLMICTNVCYGFSSFNVSDVGLDIYNYLKKYNYTLEDHTVTTSDGYILGLHRITTGRNGIYATEGKPPILLVHGLISSSMDYVNYGPGRSLGLMLADGGYDVWLVNCRGNTWSRKHKTLSTTDREFYQFSFHEIGVYDLPATIDYILDKTNKDQLSYIGHSQGCTTFFIMGSVKPDYMKKINVMAALAPAVFMANTSHPLVKLAAQPLVNLALGFLIEATQMYLVVPHYDIFTSFATLCEDKIWKYFCASVYYDIAGKRDEEQIDYDSLPMIFSNAPAGISYRQAMHYLQEIRSGNFEPYNFGVQKNREIYNGKHTAEPYNLKKIAPPPITIYYGDGDTLASPTNVEQLADIFPSAELKFINSTNFTHLDFLWSKDIVELLNNDVIELMNKYNDVKISTVTTETSTSEMSTGPSSSTTTDVPDNSDSATAVSGSVLLLCLLFVQNLIGSY